MKNQSSLNCSAQEDALDNDCNGIRNVSFDVDNYEAHIQSSIVRYNMTPTREKKAGTVDVSKFRCTNIDWEAQ